MSNQDLDWLAAQQPQQRGTDGEAHDRALLSLLRHATSRPAERRRRSNFAGLLRPRVLTVATGTGLAAIAAAVVLSAGGGVKAPAKTPSSHAGVLQAIVTRHHARSPLIRLADQLSSATTNGGDATLLQRTTTITGQQPITVYDLYSDNGTYYFSQSESGLPSQVSGDITQGGALFQREMDAAKEAVTGSVSQAAIDIANAPDPNRNPLITPSSPGPASTGAIEAKEKATGMPQGGTGSLFDNWAWEDSQDAIIAGASDPQVRAGVLKILATLPDVTVTDGTSDGTPTLILTGGADEVGSGYQEQLTINAETGMPIQFVGGAPNGTAATTVSYQVKRVTLSDIAAGTVPGF